MNDLRDYVVWAVVIFLAATIVGRQLDVLVSYSGELGGLVSGTFLSLFLGSVGFLTIRKLALVRGRWLQGKQLTAFEHSDAATAP